jgi:hypothetical protein
MSQPKIPRLAGPALRLVWSLLRSPAAPLLRRTLGAQLVDRRIGPLDLSADGDPAPLYQPERYRRVHL